MDTQVKIPLREKILLVALFCFAISFFNLGGYIFAFTAVIVILLNIRYIKINLSLLALILFSASYFVFHAYWHGIIIENFVKYFIGPWAAYLIGKLYVERSKNKNAFILIILVLSAGMFLHGVLNYLAYVTSDFYSTYGNSRIAVDFWRGTVVSVTVTGMFYTFATGISLGTIFFETRKNYKIIALVVLSIAVMISATFANRTLLAIVFIISLIELTRITFSNKISSVAKVAIISALIVMIVFVVVTFTFDLWNVREWFFSLKIVQRYDDPVGRLEAWSSLFKDDIWLRYPFGNPNNSFRHNLWLDVYGEVGVIPFAIIILLTVHYIKRFFVFRACMNNKRDRGVYNAIKCLCIALILNCAVEPVVEANPYYFLIVLMFMGAIEGKITRCCVQEKYYENCIC